MSTSPFSDLLELPTSSIRTVYSTHRDTRDSQQRQLLLTHRSLTPDPLLSHILSSHSDFSLDARHNLSFITRPSPRITSLILHLQQQLRTLAGDSLWYPPPSHLHLTVYEVTHSLTSAQLAPTLALLRAHPDVFDLPRMPTVTLDSPLVNFDTSAIALTFLPSSSPSSTTSPSSSYTLHHLRHDVCTSLTRIGVPWQGRYIAPSAHATIARLISTDAVDKIGVEQWVGGLERLREECTEGWADAVWRLGEGSAEVSAGRSWYGKGTRGMW